MASLICCTNKTNKPSRVSCPDRGLGMRLFRLTMDIGRFNKVHDLTSFSVFNLAFSSLTELTR